jgi:hypothetical protein
MTKNGSHLTLGAQGAKLARLRFWSWAAVPGRCITKSSERRLGSC